MILAREFLLAIALFVHVNESITFKFFPFQNYSVSNKTKSKISIEPSKTFSTIISTTEAFNTSRIVIPRPDPYPFVLEDNEKHEFENETDVIDASPEITDSVDTNPIKPPGGQEIDETRNSSEYSVTESVDEDGSKKASNVLGMKDYLPSFPKITSLQLPSFPKRKVITFTTTLVSKFTRYETVYPSCVKFENVKSTCDGTLLTIQPTPTLLNQKTTNTYDESFDVIEPLEPKHNKYVQRNTDSKKPSEKFHSDAVVIEPSELDYEFEEINVQKNTPNLEKVLDKVPKPTTVIESLLVREPKFEFVTEYLSITSVQTVINHKATATVIAHNCVPHNMELKMCPKPLEIVPLVPILPGPIVYKNNNTNIKDEPEIGEDGQQKVFSTSTRPDTITTPVQESQKPLDLMEELNQYFIMNADRILGSSGYHGTIDLNADSAIVEPSLQPQFYYRKRSPKVQKEH